MDMVTAIMRNRRNDMLLELNVDPTAYAELTKAGLSQLEALNTLTGERMSI